MSDILNSKILEPFSFWPHYASAIRGFGGTVSSPDPFYCFHTPYQEYRTGTVQFVVRFGRARASMGEIVLYVHAFRPDKGMDAVMIAGARASLEGLDGDLEMTVRIASIPGITYAVFARFSEQSDLIADSVEVSADETDGEESGYYASTADEDSHYANEDFNPAPRLQSDNIPSLTLPISQVCTTNQIESQLLNALCPVDNAVASDTVAHWQLAFALQALKCYGMTRPGSSGALIGDAAERLTKPLLSEECLITPYPHQEPDGKFDFLVSIGTLNRQSGNSDMQTTALTMLKHVLRGGIAIFIFDYAGRYGPVDAPRDSSMFIPSETQVKQLALHILGHRSNIMQLSFASDGNRVVTDGGLSPFGLIVRR